MNARTTDPLTSHEAAESIDTSTIRYAILHVLDLHGPMAPEEIAIWLNLTDAQTWKRCSDLKRDGLIYVYEAGGHTNRSGRRADILAAVRP